MQKAIHTRLLDKTDKFPGKEQDDNQQLLNPEGDQSAVMRLVNVAILDTTQPNLASPAPPLRPLPLRPLPLRPLPLRKPSTFQASSPFMCRLLLYKGKAPIQLANLLTKPAHSIINQAYDSRLRLDRRRPINGDGFGVGWYEHDADPEIDNTPCIFTSVTPAWNNTNLIRLAEKIKSELVFAHVRASTAGVVSETNCHPWQYGRFMWMHNGGIADFNKIKRTLQNTLREELFLFVQGNTDSEWAFALFLNQLEDPLHGSFDHVTLKRAMLKTIEQINLWSEQVGITEPSLLNFAVTDGESVVCTRYISSSTEEAASLYFSSGTRFESYKPGHYRMIKADRREDIVVVASEPLTFEKADWLTIPTNTVLVITPKFNVLLYPIRDQYYNPDPHRSAEKVSHSSDVPFLTSEPVAPQPIELSSPDATDVRIGEVERKNGVENADIGRKPNGETRSRNTTATSSTSVTGFKDRDNDTVLGNGCAAKGPRLSGSNENSRAGTRDLFREKERERQKEREKERVDSNGGFGIGAVPLPKRGSFKARLGVTTAAVGRDSSSMKVV